MSELIKREDAIKITWQEPQYYDPINALAEVREKIRALPTVDAVPVVHAYWIIKPHGTYDRLRAFCSACGKHSGIGGIVSNQKKPYCPNCGARMKGEQDGEQ